MIMVRRNELACRDEWSRSLWAPAESSSSESDPPFSLPKHLGPLPPAGTDELRALAQISERELPQLAGEDVLLSEARIIAEPYDRVHRSSSTSQGFDVRSAVFRAREAYKERNRARDVAARKSDGATPLPVSDQELESAIIDDPTRQREGGDEDSQWVAELLPTVVDRSTFVELPPVASNERRRQSSETQVAASHDSLEGAAEPVTAIEPYGQPSESLSWFLETTPADVDEMYDAPVPEMQLTELLNFTSEPLPAWFRTELPHMCRTCRDFRPTADGHRGWCANAWAFNHPRLVNEDDVTPCDSAFGDWWAAVDDIWLVAADVSNHSRPTPLLDRLIAQNVPVKKQSRGTI